MKKKGQGEIFGIALLFVVIIIGIMISAKISALTPDRNENEMSKSKYELLAQTSLATTLDTTTKCNVDGNSGYDTIKDLINTCLAKTYNQVDPLVYCPDLGDGNDEIPICETAISIINNTLLKLYNGSNALIGNIPFLLEIDIPANQNTPLSNKTISNFNQVKYKNIIINESNYRKNGFQKASSDLTPWATAQREIKMTLFLYYR